MRYLPDFKTIKHLLQRSAILFVMGILMVSGPVYAQTADPDTNVKQDEIRAYIGDTPWYDPNASVCGIVDGGEGGGECPLVGEDNIEKAFNFFMCKGLSMEQSAGIVGNLMQETSDEVHGINPSSGNPAAEGGGGGIAQWEGGRWNGPNGLLAFAEENNKPWDDLGLQLEFLWREMPHQFAFGEHLPALQAILPEATSETSSLKALQMSTTYEIATRAFMHTFERASIPVMENRIANAAEVLALYGNQQAGDAGGCGAGVLVGEYSFPLAPQTKRNYGYTLPCESPILNGPWTNNGVYTDDFGKSTEIRPCHHDATPAFDLSYGDVGNKTIYAITDGVVEWVRDFGTCNSIAFRANIESDKSWYWYGHIIATVSGGDEVSAGDPIGRVAPFEYGASCWQGGVHLHIDRGCVKGGDDISVQGEYGTNGTQPGGYQGCRDPGFLEDLQAIWEALPAE